MYIACAVAAAACALRFVGLEHQSLWNDEMFSLDVALSPLGDIQQKLVTSYHHPPLFFYLAHAALKLLGPSAWALRLTSAIAGGLTAGLVFSIVSKLFRVRAGLAAGLLCTIAPFHLAYSQEGRPYALAGLLCLASFYCLYLLMTEKKSLSLKILYILSTVALLYTHHWGVFALAAQIILLLSRRKVWEIRQTAPLLGVICLAYLPEFLALRSQAASLGGPEWFWVERPHATEIPWLAAAYSGSYFRMASASFSLPPVWQILSTLALGAVLASVLFSSRGAGNFFLSALGLLLLIPFALSFLKPEVFLWYRYTVIGFPLVCVALGGALTAARGWRTLSMLAFLILAASALVGIANYTSWSKANPKEVAAYVETITGERREILIRPRSFAPLLNYYYKGNAIQFDEAYLNQPLGEIVDTAAAFVYISLDVPNEIRNYMDSHFLKTAERRFPGEAHMGIVVGSYEQKPESDE